MRAVSLAIVGLFLVSPLLAQPGTPTLSQPPLANGQPVSNTVPVAATEPPALPNGADISKPLQPVVVPPPGEPKAEAIPKTPIPVEEDRDPKPGHVLGSWWDNDELLIWWPRPQSVPPLITASRVATLPTLGRPETSLLLGNRSIDSQDIAGYRMTVGWSLNKADTVGFEARYFFLGTRTLSYSVGDAGNPHARVLGMPYINAFTGTEDALPVASPGISSSLITASATTRVQGAEANVVANLYSGKGLKVHAIAGYRFFQVNEGLNIQQTLLAYTQPGRPQTMAAISDQFDGRNEFHGGQIGLMADAHRGMFYVEVTGKVALGRNYEVAFIDGETHLLTAASPFPYGRSFPGGVYAQPTNMGRYSRSAFAVVPEAMFKVGFKLGDRGRVYVGYNFLYMSDVGRPADQLDRTLNPSLFPLNGGPGGFTGPDRPRFDMTRTDFWVQGLVIGFETRF